MHAALCVNTVADLCRACRFDRSRGVRAAGSSCCSHLRWTCLGSFRLDRHVPGVDRATNASEAPPGFVWEEAPGVKPTPRFVRARCNARIAPRADPGLVSLLPELRATAQHVLPGADCHSTSDCPLSAVVCRGSRSFSRGVVRQPFLGSPLCRNVHCIGEARSANGSRDQVLARHGLLGVYVQQQPVRCGGRVGQFPVEPVFFLYSPSKRWL
mmetsp:Transcript_122787/g.306669  ORF Transcript_122787/g.306669 Transcript_122787/m.306669 type:complete len:212 (-) Transcript_122787:125-760(-)